MPCHRRARRAAFARGTKTLDHIIDDLSPWWDASHWWHTRWERCFEGIKTRATRFGDQPVIILIGHSYGCLRAWQIALRLNSRDLKVSYIAAIDPTALPPGHVPMAIPDNVHHVDEFHATFGWPGLARWRDPAGGRGGKYVFGKDWPGVRTLTTLRGGHVACASSDITRTKIINRVTKLVS